METIYFDTSTACGGGNRRRLADRQGTAYETSAGNYV
jgi:hypothetical protein